MKRLPYILLILAASSGLAQTWSTARWTTYAMPMTVDATIQVGAIVQVDASNATCTGYCADVAANATDSPIGIYWSDAPGTGAATAHATTTYPIVVAGLARVLPLEDHANITVNQIVYAENDAAGNAGQAEFSDTVGGANHNAEVGHTLEASNKQTFVGTTGVDPDTDIITLDADPTTWAVGDAVVFYDSGDTAPTGLADGTYWLVYKSGANVKISATRGGAPVDITADGSGTTMYLQRLPMCLIHWN